MFQNIRTRNLVLVAVALCLFASSAGRRRAGAARRQRQHAPRSTSSQLLPRIGPAVAARIVEHREKNGAFKTADDLMLVRGIGESTFERLKPYVATLGRDDAHREGEAAARAEGRNASRRERSES